MQAAQLPGKDLLGGMLHNEFFLIMGGRIGGGGGGAVGIVLVSSGVTNVMDLRGGMRTSGPPPCAFVVTVLVVVSGELVGVLCMVCVQYTTQGPCTSQKCKSAIKAFMVMVLFKGE